MSHCYVTFVMDTFAYFPATKQQPGYDCNDRHAGLNYVNNDSFIFEQTVYL